MDPPSPSTTEGTHVATPSRRTLPMDLISQPFIPFDYQSAVVTPYKEQLDLDDALMKELKERLLNALMLAHAWCSARPRTENELAAQRYNSGVDHIIAAERKQELSRARVHQVIMQFRSALGMLVD